MTAAVDASGNGHNGTYVGGPSGATGLVVGDADAAVAFDPANNQYVLQDDTIGAQSFTAITLGCIVKPADPTDANEPTFYGLKGTNDNINFSANADGTITFFAKDGVGAINGFLLNSVTVLSAGAIYRLIGTWDGTTAKLWINGALDASVAYANAVTLAAAEKFFFGADQFDETGNISWHGVGDEAFFVPNHAATVPEVAAIDAAMTGTGSVVTAITAIAPYIYWRLGDLASGPITEGPTVRLVTARSLVVPHQIQRWVLPIICKDKIDVGEGDYTEQSQSVAEIRDYFIGLRRTGTPVVYQEGNQRHLVVVRDVSFPEGQVERWGNQRDGLQGILVITLDSTEG